MNIITQVGAVVFGAGLGHLALLIVFMVKNDSGDIKAPDLIPGVLIIDAALITLSLFMIFGGA